MDKAGTSHKFELGDRTTSDVTIRLRNRDGRPEWFYCHSSVLSKKSKFFAERLSDGASTHLSLNSTNCIEIYCSGSEYDNHVKLLKLLYLTEDPLLESWESVKTALGVLQASASLGCEGITQSCIQYLEAMPWEENEEEEIIKTVPKLGPAAMPILARIQPVDQNAAKDVFISAIRFATTMDGSFPPFTDELKTSAQEQVEYMLMEDEETPLLMVDEDVRSEVKKGLSKMFSTFDVELGSLAVDFDHSPEASEQKVLQSLIDLEWSSNILPKMDLMTEFVTHWTQISGNLLSIVQNEKLDSGLWAVKAKLIELTCKALEVVGYGNVILPAPSRFQLLKTWLPYIRKMKPKLDHKAEEDESFPYKMDGDLCQTIEGAIISLVLALPSSDQADILTDWMKTEQSRFPDLSEAFEVWSYRTKAAKRRLAVGLDGVGNPTVSL
uniref:BTB/POZ domain-containing protein At3g05675 n=1 Tax=Anthurium amnicola TaxID=1678845 RepID=A0A1D1YQ06_9ARAE